MIKKFVLNDLTIEDKIMLLSNIEVENRNREVLDMYAKGVDDRHINAYIGSLRKGIREKVLRYSMEVKFTFLHNEYLSILIRYRELKSAGYFMNRKDFNRMKELRIILIELSKVLNNGVYVDKW